MDDGNYTHIFADTFDHLLQPEKAKDSLILMKQKICKTNDLIKQYSDKIKEAERLKSDLETVRKDSKHIISNYKFTMDKTRELELNITEIKQENNQLESKIKEYITLAAADKQNIQQLICKIKQIEDEHSSKILEFDLQKSSFEDEIKKLEHEIKILKNPEVKKKKSNIVTNGNNTIKPSMETKSWSDVGINVSLDNIQSNIKPKQVHEKNTMTDEFYHLKDDPYPVFCAKCTSHINPPPIERICQIMCECPDLIEPIFSPKLMCPLSPLSIEKLGHSSISDKEPEHANKNISDKQLQHLGKNILDEEQECLDMNVSDEKTKYSNKNISDKESEENKMASKVSSSPHLLVPVDHNSVKDTHNLQFESKDSFVTAQNLVNINCKDESYMKCKPIATDSPNNLDLITEHSSSIKNMEKTMQLLEHKMKKRLKKMKKKINKKQCCNHTTMNCNNVDTTSASTNIPTSLNSDLLVNICKSMIELNKTNQKEVPLKKENYKNERRAKLMKYRYNKYNMKKVKLKRLNNFKGEFSWEIEHLYKMTPQDTVLTKLGNNLPVINESLITEKTINQSDLPDKISPIYSTEAKSVAEVETVAEVKTAAESAIEVKSVAEVETVTKVKTAAESAIEVKSVAEVETVAEVKISAESAIEVKSVAEVETITEVKTAAESAIEVKSVAEVETVAEVKTAAESAIDVKSVAEVETVTKVKTAAESAIEVKSVAEVETVAEVKISAESAIEVKSVAEVETITEVKTAAESAIEVKSVAEVETITEVKTAAESAIEVKSVAEVETITEVKTAAESAIEVKSVAEVETVAEVKIAAESAIEVKSVAEVESTVKMKSIAEAESVTEMESVTEVKPATEAESVTKLKPIVDNALTLYSSTDETYMCISSSTDNVKSADSSYIAPEMTLPSSHSESSINCFNNNIVNTITAKRMIKNKKRKPGDLLKKIRNLKRKTRYNSDVCLSKRSKVELCSNDSSEFYEPTRKRRIAHVSKASASQPDFKRNSIHNTVKNVAESKVFENLPVNTQISKEGTSVDIKTDCMTNDKRDKKNSVKSTLMCRSNKKSLTEKNSIENLLLFTKSPDFSPENNNTASVVKNIRQEGVSLEFVDPNNDRIDSDIVNNDITLTKKTMTKIFNNCNKPEALHSNILSNTTSDEESNRHVLSNVFCEDLQNYKFTEDVCANTVETTSNTFLISPKSPSAKSCDYKSDVAKVIYNQALESQSIESQLSYTEIRRDSLSVNNGETYGISKECYKQSTIEHNESQDVESKFIKGEDLSSLKRRNITEDHVNDNKVRKFDSKVNIGMEKQETCVADKKFGISDLSMSDGINNYTTVTCSDNNDNKKNNDDNDKYIYNVEQHNIKDNIKDIDIKYSDIKNDNMSIYNEDENVGKTLTPMNQLHNYINTNLRRGMIILSYKNRKTARKVISCAGTFVTGQLTRLLESQDWDDYVHDDVVKTLNIMGGPRFIAKCIIEFLAQHSDSNLDNTFTPPAPMMSRCEQKIITLLIDLEQLRPTIIAFTRAGIQYKLFRLNNNLKYMEVNTLTRVYVALARLQNDREAVRIMCCDALYCLGLHAINVLYAVLTCWPEIFPQADACKGLLPKCIAFLTLQLNNIDYHKLIPLKILLKKYYQYSQEMRLENIVNELMITLADKQQDGLNTAIILVAKKNGPTWTYKNFIKTSLLPTIIHRKYPCMYNAFCLLGKLMRSFPLESPENTVKDISKQFSDLLKSNRFSDNEEEGIASALLNLSRHEFDIVTMAVIKWTPKNSLRPNTMAQIEAHIKSHTPKFWKTYAAKKKIFKDQNKKVF